MGVYSDLKFDQDKCTDCGQKLHANIVSISSKETLREYDGEPHIALMKLVECRCGHVNSIDYIGEPLCVRFEVLAEKFIATVQTV
jgi:hypothetical protein